MLKAVIVENLEREDLRRVVESLGVEGADRRSADSMRAAVRACRRATAESLLGCLGKDSLKAVCAVVGVRAAGRREELIERILSGNGRSQGATGKKRERSMSEEATKPETSARLTAPQREARDMATGNGGKLDVPRLENWLWEAACVIRGPVDAPKFKDYILPLVFLKRLSDVFDDEVRHLAAEFGSEATAAKLVEKVFRHVEMLRAHPYAGSRVPELLPAATYRQIVESPCRLFYRYDKRLGKIFVLGVMRGERLFQKVLLLERDETLGD